MANRLLLLNLPPCLVKCRPQSDRSKSMWPRKNKKTDDPVNNKAFSLETDHEGRTRLVLLGRIDIDNADVFRKELLAVVDAGVLGS